jgi:hypothetical protein
MKIGFGCICFTTTVNLNADTDISDIRIHISIPNCTYEAIWC